MQVGKLILWSTGLAGCNNPVHAFYENLDHLFTGVSDMWQAMQPCPAFGGINSAVDELNLVHTSTYKLQTSMYQYILVHTYYLGSDEVTNHERECEHQHFHAITSHHCHLGIFLAINIHVVEMGSVFSGQGDHGSVSHHSFQAASQTCPYFLDAGSCYKGISFAVDKVRTPEHLGILMQHSRHNVVTKEPQIPADSKLHSSTYWYILVHTSTYQYIYYY